MIKKALILSFITIAITYFFGDNTSDLIAIILNVFLFTSNRHPSTNSAAKDVFTIHELKLHNGVDKPELYLAVLGNIYDVSRGEKHYGPGKQYNVFVGCDASRSFVTGKFDKDDISDEVADFNNQELRSLNHWLNFYRKEYPKVGKLIGKYYDESGKLTPYGKAVRKLIKDAEAENKKDQLEKTKFPPCNVEWDAVKGSKVWCSNKSGGIEREWIGFPRQLYEPGSKTYRCACMSEHNEKFALASNIKEYDGCEKNSLFCYVKVL